MSTETCTHTTMASAATSRPRRAAAMRIVPENEVDEAVEVDDEPRLPKRARTSRALHRKTDHSVIERRRREKINDRLVCLQSTVPACREKAREYVQKKASGSAPLEGEELEARIGADMVLEKLCIISHTVDYVMELRAKLKAYEAQCHCDPQLPSTADRDDNAHCLTTHPEKMRCERTTTSEEASSESSEHKADVLLHSPEHEEDVKPAPMADVHEHGDACVLGDDDDDVLPPLPHAHPSHAHHHHHHHAHAHAHAHDMWWWRPWRPMVPWQSRGCHMHMCYDTPPMYAAAAPPPPPGTHPAAMAATPACGAPPPPLAASATSSRGAPCHHHHHHHHRHACELPPSSGAGGWRSTLGSSHSAYSSKGWDAYGASPPPPPHASGKHMHMPSSRKYAHMPPHGAPPTKVAREQW